MGTWLGYKMSNSPTQDLTPPAHLHKLPEHQHSPTPEQQNHYQSPEIIANQEMRGFFFNLALLMAFVGILKLFFSYLKSKNTPTNNNNPNQFTQSHNQQPGDPNGY